MRCRAVFQTSNAITVTGTTLSAPISVSSGAEYSINGGPFTSAPGTVQPGDRITVQMIAPSTYRTTASAIVTIGGVTSTYTVTTATQAIPAGRLHARHRRECLQHSDLQRDYGHEHYRARLDQRQQRL